MTSEWKRTIGLIGEWMEQEMPGSQTIEATTDTPFIGQEIIWVLQHGSATVLLSLRRTEYDVAVELASPILRLPAERREEFLTRLLRLNASEAYGCAFALSEEDDVIVFTGRSTADLSLLELDQMIRRVAGLADKYDDLLAEEFGAEMIDEE